MNSRISHIELNVSNYLKSIRFYDRILPILGWSRLSCTREFTSFSDGVSKIILSPVADNHSSPAFHRKRVGLNHLALKASSRAEVDAFYRDVLLPNQIPTLYSEGATGDDEYYALYFEDPDRVKIELVFAPRYCDPSSWPNNLPNDFDPESEAEPENTCVELTSAQKAECESVLR